MKVIVSPEEHRKILDLTAQSSFEDKAKFIDGLINLGFTPENLIVVTDMGDGMFHEASLAYPVNETRVSELCAKTNELMEKNNWDEKTWEDICVELVQSRSETPEAVEAIARSVIFVNKPKDFEIFTILLKRAIEFTDTNLANNWASILCALFPRKLTDYEISLLQKELDRHKWEGNFPIYLAELYRKIKDFRRRTW